MSEELRIDPAAISVGVGFPCGPQVPWQTALSLAATARTCAEYGIPMNVHVVAGNSSVTDARNIVLTNFLKADDSRLFWIDSDIVWKPSDFLRVLLLTRHYDVVSAAYPLKRPGEELVINGATRPYTQNEHGCIKVKSLGIGFTCLTRAVAEKWTAGKQWKKHGTGGEDIVQAFSISPDHGEDIGFFNEIGALGCDVWLDPSVMLGHVGVHVYQRDVADALGLTVFTPTKE